MNLKERLTACKTPRPSKLANRREKSGSLWVYGVIGFPELGGTPSSEYAAALAELRDCTEIAVYINSPGGDFQDGLAIYNQLVRLEDAEINVFIDGEAASAASIVAMAGDTISIAPQATIMIHDVRSYVQGTADELRSAADKVDAATAGLIDLYAQRTGLPKEQIAEMLRAETTLTAEQAVELRFATQIDEPVRLAALAEELPAGTIRIRCLHTPAQLAVMKAQNLERLRRS